MRFTAPKYCVPSWATTLCLLSFGCLFYASIVECLPELPAHQIKANLMQSTGFRLHAKIDVWHMDSISLAGQVELTETYSVANERSVIELKIPIDSGLTGRKYYVNGRDNQVIMVESEGKKCEAEDRASVLSDILSYMAAEPRQRLIEKWTGLIEGVPDYLLGAGRILHYVDQNRDQMKMTIVQNIRERKANRYSMNSPLDQNVTMSVSLAESAFSTWNGAELPLRVWFKSDNFGFIMIDFFLVESLASHTPIEDAEYHLDPTTVELGLRCQAPTSQDLVMPFREVYSMRADVIDVLDDSVPARRSFLAYDGKQMAFRRDILHEDGSPSTSTIYDFQRQLKFNIKHPQQQLSVDEDKKFKSTDLGAAIKAKEATIDCVAAVSAGGRETLFTIPYSELVYMGSGIVRGIEVDIYENYNFLQPHLFFPPASYTNRTGDWKLQADTLNAMNTKFGQQYSAIYYFARASTKSTDDPKDSPPDRDSATQAKNSRKILFARFDQLIRVDLMLGGHLLKKVSVYDFVWQLTDGPNGDRQETLFSVPSECFRGASTSSGVCKLSQQLTLNVHMNFIGASQKDTDERDVMVLLDSPVVRYEALARALAAHPLDLGPSRLLKISSSLTKSGEHPFQMHASIKLSLAEGDAWHADWVGTFVRLWPGSMPIEGATNFDECFFEAVRRRRGGELLFAFIRDKCYIDVAPGHEVRKNEQGAKEVEFTFSSVFRLSRLVPTPHLAMRIELVPSKGRTRASKFQDKIYGALMDNYLSLPVVDTSRSELLGESIIFHVGEFEFASRRGDEMDNGAEESRLDLSGLVFMKGLEVEQSPNGEDMSYEICRATCLMDLACRSYSVCTSGTKITCRTSELDFDDPNLLSKLGPKLKEARAARNTIGASMVSFDYQPQTVVELEPEVPNEKIDDGESKQEQPAASKQQVDLGLDKRCRVYKKKALDMFLEMPRSEGLLNSKVVLQVDNEEECAKRCLDNNVQFFSRVPNAGLQTKTNELNSDEIIQQNKKRMTKWCAMFKYSNLKASSDGRKLLAQLTEQKKDSICILSKARGGLMRVNNSDKELRAKIEMDTFEFEYVNLYEPIRNFQMSFNEQTVLQAGSAVGTLRRKMAEMGSPEECARACFTQTIGLEPRCKSFEFVELKPADANSTSGRQIPGEGSVRVTTLCAFNSISLHDAFEADIYDQVVSLSGDPQAAVTFYEPRKAYTINDSVLKRLIGSVPDGQIDRNESGGLVLFLVLILALASGIALGIQAKELLVKHWLQRKNNGKDLIARRRFSNSVELGAQDGENL